MLRLKVLAAACVLAMTAGAANANTFTTFDVDAAFNGSYHPAQNLTGTLTVDVTAGTVTSGNLFVSGFSAFTEIIYNLEQFPPYWSLALRNASGEVLNFLFTRTPSVSGVLAGMTGGAIAGGDLYVHCTLPSSGPSPCHNGTLNWEGDFAEYFGLNSLRGTITAEVSATPLPAALPLFASGLGITGLLAWRRKRKAAAAI